MDLKGKRMSYRGNNVNLLTYENGTKKEGEQSLKRKDNMKQVSLFMLRFKSAVEGSLPPFLHKKRRRRFVVG